MEQAKPLEPERSLQKSPQGQEQPPEENPYSMAVELMRRSGVKDPEKNALPMIRALVKDPSGLKRDLQEARREKVWLPETDPLAESPPFSPELEKKMLSQIKQGLK